MEQRMISQIKPGSIVQLKSGGPVMTVNWIEHRKDGLWYAFCEWLIQDAAPSKKDGAVFPFTSLKLLETVTSRSIRRVRAEPTGEGQLN
jgi:uncharacterized protein YodC (DUF2158 family)